jgi:hypothetical protein
MDDERIVRRALAVHITVGTARRLFPGINRSALYADAPHNGRDRRLTLGQAFAIARQQFEAQARQAHAASAAEARTDAQAARQASVAMPALGHLIEAVGDQCSRLAASLRCRGASARAVSIIERVAAVNSRHGGRARARLQRFIQLARDHEPA